MEFHLWGVRSGSNTQVVKADEITKEDSSQSNQVVNTQNSTQNEAKSNEILKDKTNNDVNVQSKSEVKVDAQKADSVSSNDNSTDSDTQIKTGETSEKSTQNIQQAAKTSINILKADTEENIPKANIDDWYISTNYNPGDYKNCTGVIINGYKGHPQVNSDGSVTIVIPNSADFLKANYIISLLDSRVPRRAFNVNDTVYLNFNDNGFTYALLHNPNIIGHNVNLIISDHDGGKIKVKNVTNGGMFQAFEDYYCTNKYNSIDVSGLDTSDVTNMVNAFAYDSNLTKVKGLENWDTSNVTDFSKMFHNDFQLGQVNLTNWDTSKATNMDSMFGMYNEYKNPIEDKFSELSSVGDLSNWKVGKVTNMSRMFSGCNQIHTLGNLDNWDVSNVTDLSYAFWNMYNLEKLGDLRNWKTGKVTNMEYTFAIKDDKGSLITTLGNLSTWDVSNVKNFQGTFSHLSKIKSLGDLSDWNVSKAENMNYMFYLMKNLNSIGPDLSKWDTRNVTSTIMMFMDDHNLTSLNEINKWNMSNNTATNGMFCRTGLTNIDISNWDLSKDTNTNWMFTYELNPMVINMKGVKLPESTNFELMSFYGEKPMVVYSDEGSKLFELNNKKLDNHYDWVGKETITVTGRQNTNFLKLYRWDSANDNQSQAADDQDLIATIPMNFVFKDKDDLISQMKALTTPDAVNEYVHKKYGDKINATSDNFETANNITFLKNEFDVSPTNLVIYKYKVKLATEENTQPGGGEDTQPSGGDDNHKDQNPPVDDNHDNSNNHEQPNTDNEKPAKPGEKHTEKGNNARIGKQVVHTDNQKPLVHSSDVERAKLPQTGTHNTSSVVAVLGGLGLLLGLAFLEKSRRHD